MKRNHFTSLGFSPRFARMLVIALFLEGIGGAFDVAAQAPAPAAPAPAAPAAAAPAAPAAPVAPTPTPKPIRQVRAEMRILEWQLTNTTDFDFAVLFQGDPGSILGSSDLTLPANPALNNSAKFFLSGLDTGSGNFQAVIDTLGRAGSVKVLSQPSVILTVDPADSAAKPMPEKSPDKYDAQVKNNTRIPFAAANAMGITLSTVTNFQEAGVTLECNARDIKFDQFVQLQIKASVSDLTGFINIGKDIQGNPYRVPVMDNRLIQNQVLVRDRSIFISGLLKSTREVERRRGIPWLSELPGLGWLLSSKSKSDETIELVFLVRPEILDNIEATR